MGIHTSWSRRGRRMWCRKSCLSCHQKFSTFIVVRNRCPNYGPHTRSTPTPLPCVSASLHTVSRSLRGASPSLALRIGRSSMVNQSRTKNSRAPYCIYALSSPIFTCCLRRFLRHPWSSLTSMFLNFEGAGPGGYVPQLLTIYSNFNRRS
jgi:hypothetical protein